MHGTGRLMAMVADMLVIVTLTQRRRGLIVMGMAVMVVVGDGNVSQRREISDRRSEGKH